MPASMAAGTFDHRPFKTPKTHFFSFAAQNVKMFEFKSLSLEYTKSESAVELWTVNCTGGNSGMRRTLRAFCLPHLVFFTDMDNANSSM